MSEQTERLANVFGCLGAIAVAIFAVVQIYAGYIGLEDAYGKGWAIAAIVAAFLIRFMLPLTWGAFLCAKDIWDWHWAFAALFAAPGLAFMALMIPGVLASIVDRFRR